MMDILLMGLVLVTVVTHYMQTEQRLSRNWILEAKMDVILKHLNLSFDQYENVPAGVKESLTKGEPIVAIKTLREATGMGLREAKDFVAELQRRGEMRG